MGLVLAVALAAAGGRGLAAEQRFVTVEIAEYTAAAAFTADGKRLIGSDQQLNQYIWDTANWQQITAIQPAERFGFPGGWVTAADGSISAFSKKTSVEVYDLAAGKRLGKVAMDVRCLAISADGTTVAVGTFRSSSEPNILGVVILDARTLKEQRAFDLKYPPTALAFSPDAKTLAYAGFNTLGLLEVGAGKSLGKFDQTGNGDIRDVAFSPDGKAVACIGPKFIRWWTIDGAVNGPAPEVAGGLRVAFSPDGKTVAVGGRVVTLLDRTTGKQIQLEKLTTEAKSLSFSPDGKQLAVAVGKTFRVYKLDK